MLKTGDMEVVFLLAGLILAVIGGAITFCEFRAWRGTQVATGTVIGFSTGTGRNGINTYFYSVAEFIGPDGRKRYVESSVGATAPIHTVGDRVGVRVNPMEPEKTAFQSGTAFVIGIVLTLMGIGCIVLFGITFRVTIYSLIAAGVILATAALKLKSIVRKEPLSWQEWQAIRKKALRPKVFDDESKDRIAWADPLRVSLAVGRAEQVNRFSTPLLFVIGFGLVLLGHRYYLNTEAFLKSASHTSGRVVELKEVQSSDSTTWAPIIEFDDTAGHHQRFVERISSNPSNYRSGQIVDVLFNPGNPRDARIDRGQANQWAAMLLGSTGGLFILLGAFSLRRRRASSMRM
jgi:Protein of unknown function (DUF3592)